MTRKTIRFLSAADVRRTLSMPEAIAAMREAFIQLSDGRAAAPLRTRIDLPGREAGALFMPVHLPESGRIGLKAVTLFSKNPAKGLPMIHALVMVMDGRDGRPLAVIDGEHLTAMRTGAASGLATDLLAREEASVAAIFGAGVQGRTQLEAIATVRKIEKAFVLDCSREAAETFAREMGEKLSLVVAPGEAERVLPRCDIICTATPATAPLFSHDHLKPGVHINAVGSYKPDMCEIPPETVARSRVVVDSRAACLAEAGDLIQAIGKGLFAKEKIVAEIGEIAAGRAPSRQRDDETTLFKSVGNSVQDLAAADCVLLEAERLGLGSEIPW